MRHRVVVLGAGFGGLELTSVLAERGGEHFDLLLIDQNDSFFFGFSKIDVMFGRKPADAVRLPYSRISKPGVRFLQATVTHIDPLARRVTTDKGQFEADTLVVALGAIYDLGATPGLADYGHEFYSFAGAERLAGVLPGFSGGDAVIGVAGLPFKCPPAPSEAALLLHEFLTTRGVREASTISLVLPMGAPVPPSPATSQALLAAFAERDIRFIPNRSVQAYHGGRRVLLLDDGSELPCDLFLGIPKHRVPDVVAAGGLAENGWIPVDSKTLQTRFPGVYAIGDVATMGTPKAGVFAEGAAQTVAAALLAKQTDGEQPAAFAGTGSCYIEFGAERVARIDMDFLSGPAPTGSFTGPSTELAAGKADFGAGREVRWFGG